MITPYTPEVTSKKINAIQNVVAHLNIDGLTTCLSNASKDSSIDVYYTHHTPKADTITIILSFIISVDGLKIKPFLQSGTGSIEMSYRRGDIKIDTELTQKWFISLIQDIASMRDVPHKFWLTITHLKKRLEEDLPAAYITEEQLPNGRVYTTNINKTREIVEAIKALDDPFISVDNVTSHEALNAMKTRWEIYINDELGRMILGIYPAAYKYMFVTIHVETIGGYFKCIESFFAQNSEDNNIEKFADTLKGLYTNPHINIKAESVTALYLNKLIAAIKKDNIHFSESVFKSSEDYDVNRWRWVSGDVIYIRNKNTGNTLCIKHLEDIYSFTLLNVMKTPPLLIEGRNLELDSPINSYNILDKVKQICVNMVYDSSIATCREHTELITETVSICNNFMCRLKQQPLKPVILKNRSTPMVNPSNFTTTHKFMDYLATQASKLVNDTNESISCSYSVDGNGISFVLKHHDSRMTKYGLYFKVPNTNNIAVSMTHNRGFLFDHVFSETVPVMDIATFLRDKAPQLIQSYQESKRTTMKNNTLNAFNYFLKAFEFVTNETVNQTAVTENKKQPEHTGTDAVSASEGLSVSDFINRIKDVFDKTTINNYKTELDRYIPDEKCSVIYKPTDRLKPIVRVIFSLVKERLNVALTFRQGELEFVFADMYFDEDMVADKEKFINALTSSMSIIYYEQMNNTAGIKHALLTLTHDVYEPKEIASDNQEDKNVSVFQTIINAILNHPVFAKFPNLIVSMAATDKVMVHVTDKQIAFCGSKSSVMIASDGGIKDTLAIISTSEAVKEFIQINDLTVFDLYTVMVRLIENNFKLDA